MKTDAIDIKNHKYVYIEILSTNKSLEVSENKDPNNKRQDARKSYDDSNYKIH